MRYLMRDGAPLTAGQWQHIDETVVAEARNILVGRRFLSLCGPLGAQAQNVALDLVEGDDAASADFWGTEERAPTAVATRKFVQLANVYADFTISWRDIEDENNAGRAAAADAAAFVARREDELILHGDKALGIDGLLTAKGVNKLPLADWSKGENPLTDVAKAIEVLQDKGCAGTRVLVVSNDLFAKMHRIQTGTGQMEIDRVRSLVGGAGLFRTSLMPKNTAVVAYCDPRHMDLVVGQDLVTAYMGNEKMDHVFRVMETLTPRIKRPSAIAVLA